MSIKIKHPLGDAKTIVTIFTDNYEHPIVSQESTSSAFDVKGIQQPATVFDTLTPEHISKRYSAVFFFQTIHLAALHLGAAQLGVPQPPLPAPSLPHFDPRSSSFYCSHPYHGDGSPAGQGALSGPLRPWLHDGLAGTPLAALSSTTGCAWAGYYTYIGVGGMEPPMYIELRSTPARDSEADTEVAHGHVHFRGEGHDGRKFVIIGTCDTRTGVISAIKAYKTHQWEWRGMLTPFGMAGMWGHSWDTRSWGSGWWWIWPREWSPATTRDHD